MSDETCTIDTDGDINRSQRSLMALATNKANHLHLY